MNRFVWHVAINVAILVCSLLTVTALVALGWYSWRPLYEATHPPALAMSAVKMQAPMWSGSGVYLGHGFIVTAGHVADGLSSIEIDLSTGAKAQGEVLWTNTLEGDGYDVALIYAPDLPAQSASLSCRQSEVGDHISIVGNPGPLTFLTTWGRVSGPVSAGQWDRWKSLVALDIVAAPGVSGGPVYSADGSVVGILVSGLVIPGRGTYGYSMMVPSTAICRLMGRAP